MMVYDQPCRTERMGIGGGPCMGVGVVGDGGRAMRSSIIVRLLEGLRVSEARSKRRWYWTTEHPPITSLAGGWHRAATRAESRDVPPHRRVLLIARVRTRGPFILLLTQSHGMSAVGRNSTL